jgi:LysR family hydrogen peroxide-inducible transcriptional activator
MVHWWHEARSHQGRTNMNLRALRYLVALANCLSFSRAADRCAVTQSTLSIQIRKLEEYLGLVLFERNSSRVALTAAGRDVLRMAQVIVAAADDIVTFSRARARERLLKQDEVIERTATLKQDEFVERTATPIEDINRVRAPRY